MLLYFESKVEIQYASASLADTRALEMISTALDVIPRAAHPPNRTVLLKTMIIRSCLEMTLVYNH